MIVSVPLHESHFKQLPCDLKDGKLISVYPVAFNVGINEHATIAERYGKIIYISNSTGNYSLLRIPSYCYLLLRIPIDTGFWATLIIELLHRLTRLFSESGPTSQHYNATFGLKLLKELGSNHNWHITVLSMRAYKKRCMT